MITISKNENRIVVTGYGHTYSVDKETPAINIYGRPTGKTVGEEYEVGNLFVHDDNVDGESYGLHGALFAG